MKELGIVLMVRIIKMESEYKYIDKEIEERASKTELEFIYQLKRIADKLGDKQ